MKSFLQHLQEDDDKNRPIVIPSEVPGEPPSVGVRRGQVIQSGMGYPSYEEDPDFYKRMDARRAENRKGAADAISLTNYSRDAMRAIVPVLGEPLTDPDDPDGPPKMGTTTNYYSTNRETGIHTPGSSIIRLNTNDERAKQAWDALKSGKPFSSLSPIGLETLTHEVAHSKPTPESISKEEAYRNRPDKSGNAQNVPGEPPTEYLFSPDELGAFGVGLKTQIRQNLGHVVGPDTTPEQMRQWMDELKQMKDSGKSKSPPWPSKQWDYFRNSDQGTEAAIIARQTKTNSDRTAVTESTGKYYKSFLQFITESGKLYRFDDRQLTPKAQEYAFSPDNTGSGNVSGWEPPADWTRRTGLFTGKYHHVLTYAVPRSTRWITTGKRTKDSKPVVYFDESDRDAIAAHRPVLSQYNRRQGFARTLGSEYFAAGERAPSPVSQRVLENPLEEIGKHFTVKFVRDLDQHKSALDSEGVNYNAEGI
jgi:hypothetical protein